MTTTTKTTGILREIEEASRKSFLPIIGPLKGKYLAEVVVESRAKVVLEIGTLVGYSAILIASHLPDDGQLDSIEINPQSAQKAEENIRRADLPQKIRVHVGNALNVIPQIKGPFDLIFIDAEKGEYREYLRLSEGKLKPNGVVFADNVKIFASQMQDYLEYVRNSGRYSSRYIDAGYDGVEVSTKLS